MDLVRATTRSMLQRSVENTEPLRLPFTIILDHRFEAREQRVKAREVDCVSVWSHDSLGKNCTFLTLGLAAEAIAARKNSNSDTDERK